MSSQLKGLSFGSLINQSVCPSPYGSTRRVSLYFLFTFFSSFFSVRVSVFYFSEFVSLPLLQSLSLSLCIWFSKSPCVLLFLFLFFFYLLPFLFLPILFFLFFSFIFWRNIASAWPLETGGHRRTDLVCMAYIVCTHMKSCEALVLSAQTQ